MPKAGSLRHLCEAAQVGEGYRLAESIRVLRLGLCRSGSTEPHGCREA